MQQTPYDTILQQIPVTFKPTEPQVMRANQRLTVNIREYYRFALAGIIGFAVDAITLRVQIHYFGWSPYAAKPGSFLLAVCTTWWINRHYTFAARRTLPQTQDRQEAHGLFRFRSLLQEWGRYVSANALGAVINNGVYGVGVSTLPWLYRHPEVSVALGSLAGMGFNFHAASAWVFRHNNEVAREGLHTGAGTGVTRESSGDTK